MTTQRQATLCYQGPCGSHFADVLMLRAYATSHMDQAAARAQRHLVPSNQSRDELFSVQQRAGRTGEPGHQSPYTSRRILPPR